jgi:CO dehydrogenase/acetyl-CoA synthase beta subunit
VKAAGYLGIKGEITSSGAAEAAYERHRLLETEKKADMWDSIPDDIKQEIERRNKPVTLEDLKIRLKNLSQELNQLKARLSK